MLLCYVLFRVTTSLENPKTSGNLTALGQVTKSHKSVTVKILAGKLFSGYFTFGGLMLVLLALYCLFKEYIAY